VNSVTRAGKNNSLRSDNILGSVTVVEVVNAATKTDIHFDYRITDNKLTSSLDGEF
jgi:hypothetical protein